MPLSRRQVLAATHGRPGPIAGEHVSAALWFAALRYTAALVRFAVSPGDVAAALGQMPDAAVAFARAGCPRGR